MFQIIGIVLLFGLVFGSFIISGGNLGVILHALPHAALLRDTEGILDVLALLGDRRATHCAGWLSRVAGDGDCAAYWAQLADLAGRAA